ncbi:terpene synthase 8 [Artemisia annua]|uniref:Terpene synthase 8 n=1 Tax=Artemisia annua TaxID=35608 RepID=A0A2U1NSQ2_ARTAN|nr:terpene synthase 8 [Artemisia annua]
MATVNVNTNLQVHTKTTIEHVRPVAKFPPSIWGDSFLSFVLDNSKMQTYAKTMEEPKVQLRRMIIDPTIDMNEK